MRKYKFREKNGDDVCLLPLPLKNPARHHGRGQIHRMNNATYLSVNDLGFNN